MNPSNISDQTDISEKLKNWIQPIDAEELNKLDQMLNKFLREVDKVYHQVYKAHWESVLDQTLNQVAEEILTTDGDNGDQEIALWKIKERLKSLVGR
jgi:hypothetical protein